MLHSFPNTNNEKKPKLITISQGFSPLTWEIEWYTFKVSASVSVVVVVVAVAVAVAVVVIQFSPNLNNITFDYAAMIALIKRFKLMARGQFHQHLTYSFCANILVPKTFCACNLALWFFGAKILMKLKMLMKLTPGSNLFRPILRYKLIFNFKGSMLQYLKKTHIFFIVSKWLLKALVTFMGL